MIWPWSISLGWHLVASNLIHPVNMWRTPMCSSCTLLRYPPTHTHAHAQTHTITFCRKPENHFLLERHRQFFGFRMHRPQQWFQGTIKPHLCATPKFINLTPGHTHSHCVTSNPFKVFIIMNQSSSSVLNIRTSSAYACICS